METIQNPVVTGMGIISCLGNDITQIWDSLCNEIDGIRSISFFDTSTLRSTLGGEVKGNFPSDGKGRMIAFAKEAILNAINDSNLSVDEINRLNSVLVIGTSLGHLFENEDGPVSLDNFVPELLKELNLSIPFLTVSSACSSGSDAISIGCDLIQFQKYDLIISGGVDVLDIYKMTGHSSLHTLSPTKCRPFSLDNDGTSLGEGAAFLIIESLLNKQKRKASSYATIVGRSNTTDTSSITAPNENGAGAIRVIQQAIDQSNFQIEDISYINAHGSGTSANDKMEAKVYEKLFLHSKAALSSTKSAFGHTLGATGAIEAIVAITSLNRKLAPPTVGLIEPSLEWRNKNLVINKPKSITTEPVVIASVTYGFGGANACLIFASSEEGI